MWLVRFFHQMSFCPNTVSNLTNKTNKPNQNFPASNRWRGSQKTIKSRNTPWLHRSRGRALAGSGRGDPRWWPSGTASSAHAAGPAGKLSVPACACRTDHPAHPARPRSRGRCCSGCGSVMRKLISISTTWMRGSWMLICLMKFRNILIRTYSFE